MRPSVLLVLLLVPLSGAQLAAQVPSLTYGEDYTYSDQVHDVTTVQVAPNRVGHYLAGLERRWASCSSTTSM